ncbi:hypothetical protein N826_18010 [Skermanella aerolata KACC 11604]|nr:hypothetical protein N826_18010 [Skermanella aerolata KACC 11604]
MAIHEGFGAEQSRQQSGDAEIDIQLFPMQAVSLAQYFHFGQRVRACFFKSLSQTYREGEAASVGKAHVDEAAGGVETCGYGTGISIQHFCAAQLGGCDLG